MCASKKSISNTVISSNISTSGEINNDKIEIVLPTIGSDQQSPSYLSCTISDSVRRFHSTIPGYRPTPLITLDQLAQDFKVKQIYVKDESHRFNLNAFKGLGGSYAIGKVISEQMGMNIDEIQYRDLVSDATKKKLGTITFATATAGNHGKGVAWAAKIFGHKSIVYVPKGTAESRIEAIEELGAKVVVSAFNYDDTVKLCVQDAEANRWIVVQDTAWKGYNKIPRWIMQGYTTIVSELHNQFQSILSEREKPTHVFLQAGVGGMASAVLGSYINCFNKNRPFSVIIEPSRAACMMISAKKGDGKAHYASESEKGDLKTIMAGLACDEPSPLAWEVLRNLANSFVACPDKISIKGMKILGQPLGNDATIISGESGAVGMGLLWYACKSSNGADLKRQLHLNEESSILLINTEGDTDPVNYKKVMSKA